MINATTCKINKTRLRVAAILLIAITMQVIAIRYLSISGLIDKIIPWDDCGYIINGINNAVALSHGNWQGVSIKHSPLAMIPVSIAALIAPNSDVAPYAVNFIYSIALLLFVDRLLKNNLFTSVVAFVLILYTTPFISVYTEYVKTDFHGGALFFMLISFLFRHDYKINSLKSIIWPQILTILILMAKVTAFYLPGLLSVLFVLSAVFHGMECPSRSQISVVIKYHLILISLTLIAYGCLVLPNFEYFKQYITQAMLSPRWNNSGLTIWHKVYYYMPFVSEDNKFWGYNYISYALIVAFFIGTLLFKTGRKNSLIGFWLLLLLVIAAWMPLTVSNSLALQFGAFFAATLVALVFYMFREIQNFSRIALMVNLLIISASIVSFAIPQRVVFELGGMASNKHPMVMNQAKDIVDTFVSTIKIDNADVTKHLNIFFTFVGRIPAFDFGIRYFRRYAVMPTISEDFIVDESIINGDLATYQYIVMIGDEVDLLNILPEEKGRVILAQDRIKMKWNLQELSRLPFMSTDYSLYKIISRKI